MVLGFPGHTPYGGINIARATGDEDICLLRKQAAHDGSHVLRFLLHAKDNFREPLPQCAVMIDPSETQILEGKSFQAFHSILGSQRALLHIFEETENIFSMHHRTWRRHQDFK
jgi:hypothetical protein